jgi:hypothetical protein
MIDIFSLLVGFFTKVYDDVQDKEIPISPGYLELLKVLLVCFATIFLMNSFNFSLMFVVFSLVCYLVNQLDSAFWKACGLIPIITTFYNIGSIWTFGLINIIEILVIICGAGIWITVEAKLFPEESSFVKAGFRLFTALSCFTISLIISTMKFFDITSWSGEKTAIPMLSFAMGYCGTSAVTTFFMSSKASDKAESSPDLQPRTES